MILYAKSLGASATLLGVLASLTPLLTVFQIPAAHYIQRFGYRRFILAGWGTRNLCVFAVVAVPLLSFVSPGWRLAMLLGCQFVFNLLRGIASGAWLPWMTEILPEEIRARFLSRDQRLSQTGSLLAMLFCAMLLQRESQPWEFSLAFLLSAIGGAISLFFLNRVPDVKGAESIKRSGMRVPWWDIVSYPPFAKLVGFNLLLTFTFGSLPVFTVTFLRGRAGLGENQVLFLMAVALFAGVSSSKLSGKLLDRFGSKRLLRWALGFHLVFIAGWVALASRLIAPDALPLAGIFVVAGMAGSAVGIANLRLAMAIMPELGRSHFFAFYSVIVSLCLGCTPILWGVCLDAMLALEHRVGPNGCFEWNRYSVYFTVILSLTLASFFSVAGLEESRPRASQVK